MSGASAGTWYIWNGDATTATTSGDSVTVWNGWVTASANTTATASTSNDATWISWNEGTPTNVRLYQPKPETEAEKQARLVREENRREQERERARLETEALQRAEELLLMQLDEKQKQDWITQKAFEVLSQSGKRFRIRNEQSMNVDEYDAQGKVIIKHCIVPRERVPRYDQFVIQKLMLEYNEAEFMNTANHRVN